MKKMNNTLLFSVKEQGLETRKLIKLLAKEEEAEELRRRGILCFSLISHLLYYMDIYYDSLLTEFASL